MTDPTARLRALVENGVAKRFDLRAWSAQSSCARARDRALRDAARTGASRRHKARSHGIASGDARERSRRHGVRRVRAARVSGVYQRARADAGAGTRGRGR